MWVTGSSCKERLRWLGCIYLPYGLAFPFPLWEKHCPELIKRCVEILIAALLLVPRSWIVTMVFACDGLLCCKKYAWQHASLPLVNKETVRFRAQNQWCKLRTHTHTHTHNNIMNLFSRIHIYLYQHMKGRLERYVFNALKWVSMVKELTRVRVENNKIA